MVKKIFPPPKKKSTETLSAHYYIKKLKCNLSFTFRCHNQESQSISNVLVTSGSAQVDSDWSARFVLAWYPVPQGTPGGRATQ